MPLNSQQPKNDMLCLLLSPAFRGGLTFVAVITADTPGSSPAQTDDSAPHKRGRSADVDEQSSPRRSKKPKPAGTPPATSL